jgi:hypothetical protein
MFLVLHDEAAQRGTGMTPNNDAQLHFYDDAYTVSGEYHGRGMPVVSLESRDWESAAPMLPFLGSNKAPRLPELSGLNARLANRSNRVNSLGRGGVRAEGFPQKGASFPLLSDKLSEERFSLGNACVSLMSSHRQFKTR